MVERTSFDLSDGNLLLIELIEFYEILEREWIKVLDQWNHLKRVWHDSQSEEFEHFFDKLSSYDEEIEKSKSYLTFLAEQIKLGEKQNHNLNILKSLEVPIAVAQIATAILGGVQSPSITSETLSERPAISSHARIPNESCSLNAGLDDNQQESTQPLIKVLDENDMLEEIYQQTQENNRRRRNKDLEISSLATNQPTSTDDE